MKFFILSYLILQFSLAKHGGILKISLIRGGDCVIVIPAVKKKSSASHLTARAVQVNRDTLPPWSDGSPARAVYAVNESGYLYPLFCYHILEVR